MSGCVCRVGTAFVCPGTGVCPVDRGGVLPRTPLKALPSATWGGAGKNTYPCSIAMNWERSEPPVIWLWMLLYSNLGVYNIWSLYPENCNHFAQTRTVPHKSTKSYNPEMTISTKFIHCPGSLGSHWGIIIHMVLDGWVVPRKQPLIAGNQSLVL